MEIDKTEQLLNKFDYKFEKKNNQIIVKLDLAQRIIIDFSNPEKIKITDRLVGWNFLTGLIEMSIKNATIYNFIGALVLTIMFVYLDLEYDGINLIFFFLTFILWVILWTTFYLIKAENIKRTLMSWNQ
ncbi:hypothetical protein [Winogradskyella wichelsiae]|uniref:hypothetical protein n=1 Tax=Winogradskyella wichelsiae TaxID=2697007 RepID=UPI0015C8883A|nr:hypothetical protein [Winogradskyella wichelsiae]